MRNPQGFLLQYQIFLKLYLHNNCWVFQQDTFVFNKVIFFNRDQLVFIFSFVFDVLIFLSFDLYIFIWYCTFVCDLTVFQGVLVLAKFLFLAMHSKYHFLPFLVSVLHLFFTFFVSYTIFKSNFLISPPRFIDNNFTQFFIHKGSMVTSNLFWFKVACLYRSSSKVSVNLE